MEDGDGARERPTVEPDAQLRREAVEKAVRRQRRRMRRRRARAQLLSFRSASLAVGLVSVVLGGLGIAGSGPFSYLREWVWATAPTRDEAAVDGVGEPGPAGAPRATTTTAQQLEGRRYRRGDCVWWDEGDTTAPVLRTKVVPCDEPHLLEVTGLHVVDDASPERPPEAFWDTLFRSGACLVLAEQHLGAPLDPEGIYQSTALRPTEEGWRAGDRNAWCGIAVSPHSAAEAAVPGLWAATGRVRAADQHRVYAVGTCVGRVGTGSDGAWGAVPCDTPHDFEVAGHVQLDGAEPPAEDGWADAVGDECLRLAKAYAGPNLGGGVRSGWLPIQPGSWAAGRRTVLCTVAEYRDGEVVATTRALAR